ncbi:MAG: helix-turn-helix transcriptional regulator [SAR324 cluster bacterium]|nr:helix-turn-helix transcriptional regulator [SAR324 cluster bacterium]
MKRTTLAEFKKKALKNPEVKTEYEALKPAYDLRKQLVALRKRSGLTQDQLADIMHTKKSNISRLESVHSKSSPTLSTIESYAKAVGHKIEINFLPVEESLSSQ